MKKNLLYTLLGAGLLSFAACTDDFNEDVAAPQTWPEEEAITLPGFSASAAASIDLNTVTADSVVAFTYTAPSLEEGVALGNFRLKLSVDGASVATLNSDAEGRLAAAELQALVESNFGKRPVERVFSAQLLVNAMVGEQASLFSCPTAIDVKVTPKAPVIEQAYYLTGTINDWNNTNTDFKLVNGGGDVYDDPVFCIKLTADQVPADGIEFKVTPESGLGGDWSKCLCASEEEGKFVGNNAGGNIKIAYNADAKLYQIKFDMMEETWSVEALSFAPYIYEVGNNTNWGSGVPCPLAGINYDGNYKGFAYLNGEFKYKPHADGNNWDGDWEMAEGDALSGKLNPDGGNNIPAPATGFYMMDVNVVDLTFTHTLISTIGLIGDATPGGWDTDTDMTFDETDGSWNVTIDLTDGKIKFRANDGWDINWGGSIDSPMFNQGDIAVSAGNYTIKFKPVCDGLSTCSMTKN